MADQKITDMTAATSVGNADLVPIVQSGLNKKSTRGQLLTGTAAEVISLKSGSGSSVQLVSFDTTCFVSVTDGLVIARSLEFQLSGGPIGDQGLVVSAVGRVGIFFADGEHLLARNDSGDCVIDMDATALTIAISAANGLILTYIPGTPSDWATSPPADMNTAINRLASAVRILRGSPIP